MKNRFILFALFISIFGGCVSLPTEYPREQSFAYPTPENTTAGKILADAIAKHPGQSGVALVSRGEDALVVRNAMGGVAEKTLDVQYYTWKDDKVGRLLVQRLLEAADRGVRVRALLDDFTLSTRDIYLAAFDAHPNVEIRLFNPFAQRSVKALGFLTDISRVNHRMHNKLFVMDNAVAVIGGRNIADSYFGLSEKYNFRDLDVLAVGPVVQDISKSFDIFWNSQWAFPINAVYRKPLSAEKLLEIRSELSNQVVKDSQAIPFKLDINTQAMYRRLEELNPRFTWCSIRMLYDTPSKVSNNYVSIRAQGGWLFEYMKREFIGEVAYFVPGKSGVENLKKYIDRGVKVRFLTNSLASNDVVAAHAGYSTYRKRLINAGVNLYEYKVNANERQQWPIPAQQVPSRLHTKAFVIDRKFVFIGSFNADPRSEQLNTEIGLLIDSPIFAEQVIGYLDTGIDASNSYRVDFKDNTKSLRWHSKQNGKIKIHNNDPNTGIFRRFKAGLIRILPIESQL